ncbi:MAG: ABC transporter permease [Acidimicrobiales bacterium]
MSWIETLRVGLDAIRSHRLRSALTVLGIMIGIAAVILTVGLGEGAENQVSSQINALGTNVLTISPGSSTSSSGVRGGFGSASTLTQADANALDNRTVAPDIRAVAPIEQSIEELTDNLNSSNWTAPVLGTTVSWESIDNRSIALGRFITNEDVADHAGLAVLGSGTATELFSGADPVGATITVNGTPLTVVGVLNSVGSSSSSGAEADDDVIVPISTATTQLFGSSTLSSIQIQSPSRSTLTAAYQEADTELLALHGITNPTDADFQITSQSSLVSTAQSVDHTLTILLAGIAGISLLVGGIGVMNIMLVSVTERFREIGLRKALGATPGLIRRQFLLEASLLGLSGGALGVVLGVIARDTLPGAIGYPIALSATASVGALAVAIAIGVVFGVYPASRAAHLAPIDALRNE